MEITQGGSVTIGAALLSFCFKRNFSFVKDTSSLSFLQSSYGGALEVEGMDDPSCYGRSVY